MNNPLVYVIIILISFLSGIFLSTINITSEVTKEISVTEQFDNCIYQTRTGINILPNKDICCNTIKGFLKCTPQAQIVPFGDNSISTNKYCYNNKHGELKLYYNEELEAYCKNNGYLI